MAATPNNYYLIFLQDNSGQQEESGVGDADAQEDAGNADQHRVLDRRQKAFGLLVVGVVVHPDSLAAVARRLLIMSSQVQVLGKRSPLVSDDQGRSESAKDEAERPGDDKVTRIEAEKGNEVR